MLYRCLAAGLVLAILSAPLAHGAELAVPGQYKTIQAAIDAAQPGDTVRIAPGKFRENVLLDNAISIVGAGTDEKEGTVLSGKAARKSVIEVSNTDATVSNLRITGTRTKNDRYDEKNHAGIGVDHATLHLADCVVANLPGGGVWITNDGTLDARRCTISGMGNCAVHVEGAQTRANLEDCRFDQNDDNATHAQKGASLALVRCEITKCYTGAYLEESSLFADTCTISGNKGNGVYAVNPPSLKVTGSTFENMNDTGLYACASPEGTVVSGNTFTRNNLAIQLSFESRALVENNQVTESSDSGIVVQSQGTNVTLRGNHCESNGDWGIFVFQGASGEVSENVCTKNGYGGIAVYGCETAPEITANTCRENKRSGIEIAQCAAPKVYDNTLTANGTWGIETKDNSAHPELGDNAIEGNASGTTFASDKSYVSFELDADEAGFCLKKGHYARLEELRNKIIAETLRDSDGSYHIDHFCTALADYNLTDDRDAYWKMLDGWQAAYPDSLGPGITRAMAIRNFASEDEEDSNSKDPEADYRKEVEKAWNIITELERKGPFQDPNFYDAKLSLAGDLELSEQEREAILQAGIAINTGYGPFYDTLYYTQYYAFQNGKPGQTELLARVPELAGDAAADVYPHLAANMLQYNGLQNLWDKKVTIDYERAKAYFDAYDAKFEFCKKERNLFAIIACVQKDQAIAKSYFEKIGAQNSDTEYAWGMDENFEAFRKWAVDGGPYPTEIKKKKYPNYQEATGPAASPAKFILGKGALWFFLIGGCTVILCLVLGGVLLWRTTR